MDEVKADILGRDFGDSFTTGQEVVAMIEDGRLSDALRRMMGCVSLHETCGNFIKAAIIDELINDLLMIVHFGRQAESVDMVSANV